MARKSKPYKSSLQHGAGGERRGNVNFRVHMDDRQLMSKLKRLGAEGQDELRKLINEMMQKARVQSQEFLLDQKIHDRGTRGPTARSVQNVMTPKGDKNVYVQIAKSLKISDDALFVRLFSAPYPSGYLSQATGSRGGAKLALIHAGGVGAFNYAKNLPGIINSSVYWYAKTGKSRGYTRKPKRGTATKGDVSYWPKSGDMRDKQHPGFKKVDFLEPAQKYMEDNFEKEAEKLVRRLMG